MDKLKKLKKKSKKIKNLLKSSSEKEPEFKHLTQALSCLETKILQITHPDSVGMLGKKMELSWVPSITFGAYTNKHL